MKHQERLAGFRDPHELAALPPETPLAVAVSGGSDSVALLSLLRHKKHLLAVHVHHGIRGAEADRDAAFCRALADRFGIPFSLLYTDAPARAKETGESLETAAREARYEEISRLLRERGIPLLATAHHADDQLETMLQHLLRGSGTRGLSGIPACRSLADGILVVRPLLLIPKAALLDYLKQERLEYVTDSTNEEPFCQRNFLRLRVLPLLAELQPNAPLMAARCAEALAGDEQYLDGVAAEFLAREGAAPHVAALLALPQPILVRVMRRLLPEPPAAVHLAAIRTLLEGGKPHAALSLPPKTVLRIENGCLTVSKKAAKEKNGYKILLCQSENEIKSADALVILGGIGETKEKELRAYYAYHQSIKIRRAAVSGTLFVRSRATGDMILSGGMHKIVRRLSPLRVLPPEVRARMPLLADDGGILAVPYGAVRDGAAVNADLTVHFYFN